MGNVGLDRHSNTQEVENMPYFINTYRVPKPGQFTAVMQGVEGSLKSTGQPGLVNIPVSPTMPAATSMAVVGTVAGFATLDDVDAFFDRLLDDEARLAGMDKLAAMCDQVNVSVSRVVSPAWTPPEGFVPKIVSRNFAVAKPGKGPELIELVLEWGEELDSIVSVPLGGQAGAVRMSNFVESLQALEDLRQQITASPRVRKLAELINAPVMRAVGRITYIKQP